MCYWIQFASVLLVIFASMFIRGYSPEVLFFIAFMPDFGIRMILASYNEIIYI